MNDILCVVTFDTICIFDFPSNCVDRNVHSPLLVKLGKEVN
jgi:hypothetical protein